MRSLTWLHNCEDAPQQAFIEALMREAPVRLGYESEIQFEYINDPPLPSKIRKSKPSSEIWNTFHSLARTVYRNANPDLYIIGTDSDSVHPNRILEIENYYQPIRADEYLVPVILMLPVQCIEHWLLYMKDPMRYNRLNLENMPRREAKRELYGEITTSGHSREVAHEIISEHGFDVFFDPIPHPRQFDPFFETLKRKTLALL